MCSVMVIVQGPLCEIQCLGRKLILAWSNLQTLRSVPICAQLFARWSMQSVCENISSPVFVQPLTCAYFPCRVSVWLNRHTSNLADSEIGPRKHAVVALLFCKSCYAWKIVQTFWKWSLKVWNGQKQDAVYKLGWQNTHVSYVNSTQKLSWNRLRTV